MHQLAIVIVNFRTPDLVIGCLETLLPELDGILARVVVVDNGSGDESVTIIRRWLAAHGTGQVAQVIVSETNGGFAAGNNIGIRAVEAQYYLLLNSDTLIRPDAIKILLNTAEQFQEAGLYSPRLEGPDAVGQESCFRLHHPLSEMTAAAQTGAIDRVLSRFPVAFPVQTRIARPDWTSFACVMVRRDVFQQVGLLDEGYFMYFEDVEFCRRAALTGWTIVHNPDARVVHLRGRSSPVKSQMRLKKRLQRYFYESRTRYFYQAYGWWGPTAANLCWSAGRMISKARQILGRDDKAVVERQWRDIWTNWLNPMRSYTHPHRTISE